MCYTCLKPRSDCYTRRCIYYDKVPEALKCALCALWPESKDLTPFSIFFCRHKYHRDARAPLSILRTALEGYIGKLGTYIVDSTIGLSLNVNFFEVNSTAMESEVIIETGHGATVFPQAPIIDSETEYRVTCEDEDICSESPENSIYLMQTLRVGDSNCLTFFDSGAKAHLIDGRMARQEEIQLIPNKSIALGVIGGGSIKTEYGSFRFNLGPGEVGKYHEITAIGMESVTAGFSEYDLKEIIKEYKNSATSEELEYNLPETIGGSRVHLLLGIKNTRIHSTLIRVLPSGVGVYLSPFKDIWGSCIIFAGPNKEFTKANKEQMRGSSHAVYMSNTESIEENDLEHKKEFGFESKGKVQISLFTSPIEDNILCKKWGLNLVLN